MQTRALQLPPEVGVFCGKACFAAAWAEREQLRGQVVGTTLCGGNVDASTLLQVLAQAA